MKANVCFVVLEQGHTILHTFVLQPRMDRYLQFSTKSIARAILFSIFQNVRSMIQYVCNTEADFDLRLNNHRKNLQKADAIPARLHFPVKGHIFKRLGSFIIIKKIGKNTKVERTRNSHENKGRTFRSWNYKL